MDDFSGDEFFFLVVSSVATVAGCFHYYAPILMAASFIPTGGRRFALGLAPLVAAIPTYFILNYWADQAVVGHPAYIFLFMTGASAWLFTGSHCMSILGISVRDDAVERNNPAALAAASGMILAIGIAYGFSNIGSGPTIWTTIFPALVATILLFALAMVADFTGEGIADSITIERDLSSGIRLGGAMIALALILGLAAAGDWISWDRTWIEMLNHGWPALPLAFAVGLTHRKLRPSIKQPKPSVIRAGLVPALLFIVSAIAAMFVF